MSDFNLRQIVRDVLAASTMADPRDLAAEVYGRIPPDDYGTALAQCLPDVVREQIRQSRNLTTAPMAETPGGRAAPARSAKVSGIRAMWAQRLRERIHIGPAASDWRLLGDCGFDELMFAAAERRELAVRNAAKAEEYQELAEALRTAGVGRVRDLPAETLRAKFESEAA
ncbi:hypothetical protein [Streptomyces sp. NPDC088733]|uniref:hypothetical protein n=1 Tax=Streptomyces sp. NPDC088733 TaxID=3365880 RepID=UPI00381C5C11